MPKDIMNIIIHCSDSDWGCAREIRKWHTDAPPKGRGWSDIGYHFVIQNGKILSDTYLATCDGAVECGRKLDADMEIEPDEMGIHCLGYNDHSIGVCVIGKREDKWTTFTTEQMFSLRELVGELCRKYGIPADNVLGHCETESGKAQGKTCPDFDVAAIRTWLKGRV
jgi:hypothetical protein